MKARLVSLDGGPAVDLDRELVVVGRGEDCDLILDHKSISKYHCILAKTDGLIVLRDLGSTNGTRVNGQRVRRAALLPNDQLAIASFHYKVLFGQALKDELAAPPAPPALRRELPDVYPEAAQGVE